MALTAAAALVATLALPLPSPPQPTLLPGIGATAERQRVTVLPPGATATDTEAVAVGLTPAGSPASVVVDQRIVLHGQGDYVVVERGPARQAEVLGDGDPPTVKVGAVLYSGYLPPTGRLLSARLTLDPGYEASRLPMGVALSFTPSGAASPVALGAGGSVPGPGTLTVRLTNPTATVADLGAGDAPAASVAPALDTLREAALHPGARPPVAGDGLPAEIAAVAAGSGEAAADVPAPLRVTGSLAVTSAAGAVSTLSGAGTSAGSQVDGVLATTASFTLAVRAAGRLSVDLTAVPALDPRNLEPPQGFPSWQAWAASHPGEAARRDAVDRLELAAGEAAQIRSISPYLTTGLVGDVRTTFRYTLAPAAAAPAAAPVEPLHPWRIALVGGGLGLLVAALEATRRRL